MKELRPHQRKAVEELSNGKVLVGGVGTGKTLTALAYFQEKELGMVIGDFSSVKSPKDLYIFTTARKRDDLDWQLEASRMGMAQDRSASATGVKVTVDSYNNIQKYKDIHNAFIILDEQRMVGNGTWTKTFIHLAKSNRWIMLSATPGDKWEDYIPLFLANGFYRNRTEFTREHLVYSYYGRYPKLENYLGVGKLTRLRNSITVDMPYERHTTRHIHDVEVEYDKELFRKVVKDRWHVYENRPLKDVSELFAVMRKVVNSDASRLSTVENLLKQHPRVIVFYNFDYELEMLRMLVNDGEISYTNSTPFHQQELSKTLATDTAIFQDVVDSSTSVGTRPNGQTRSMTKSSLMLSPENVSIDPPMSDGMGQIPRERTSDSPSLSTRMSESSSLTHQPSITEVSGTSQSDPSKASQKTSVESTSDTFSGHPMERPNQIERPGTNSTRTSNPDEPQSTKRGKPWDTSSRNSSQLQKNSPKKTTTCTSDGSDTWSGTSERPTPRPSSENLESLSSEETSSTLSQIPSTSLETHTEELSEIPKRFSTTSTWDVLSESIQKPETTSSSPRKNESGSSKSSKIRTDTGFTVAEWNGHKHEKVPTTDRWMYLVQYAAGAEAWNCTSTDTMIFYSLTYSYRHFQQAQGRIDRLDTPFSHLHYYILKSKSYIDLAVAKALGSKKDFNEREQGLYTRV